MVALASEARMDIRWLATGEGPVDSGQGVTGEATASPVRSLEQRPQAIPVIGLAECGLAGWFRGQPLETTTARLPGLESPESFAVLAIGDSMIPCGIRPGFLCLCDPFATCAAGDAVFVEQHDGRVSIKRYLKEDSDWFWLQGWLDREGDKPQELYTEKLRRDQVIRMATVVYVKRKL